MDIELLEKQLEGLEARGKELREQEGLFLKSQGLKEQDEKTRSEITKLEADTQGMGEEINDLIAQRNDKMKDVCGQIVKSMAPMLPVGSPVIRIEDSGKIFIGWDIDGVERPYKGLSGGEKVSFDMALSKAIGAEILLVECAELDSERLAEQLAALDKFEGQVIASTCHSLKEMPEGWGVVLLQ